MSQIFESLLSLGKRHGLQPFEALKKDRVWCLDLETGAIVPETDVEYHLPARRKRGNNAIDIPFFGWDALQYAGTNGTKFWTTLVDITEVDPEVSKALKQFLEEPLKEPFGSLVGKKQIEVTVNKRPTKVPTTDWLVVTYKGRPVTDRPLIHKECERLFHEELSQGVEGVSMLTGQQGPIARTHDPIRFRGSKALLFSVNEAAMQFHGLEQATNFPVTAVESRLYTTGANALLDNPDVYLSKECALLLWPEEGEVTHPILPATHRLLGGYFKDTDQAEVAELWTTIEACEASDVVLNASIFRQNSTRISIRGYETITVANLKRNLLRFREEFGAVSFRRVSLYTEQKGRPSITPPTLWAIAWAVIHGRPYPLTGIEPVLNTLSLDYPNSRELRYAWIEALYRRRHPRIPNMTSNATSTTLDVFEQKLQRFREHVCEELLSNESRPEYRLGCIAAVFCHLRMAYHQFKIEGARSSTVSLALANPKEWFMKAVRDANLYNEKGNVDRFYKEVFDNLVAGLRCEIPVRLRDPSLFSLGFNHQDTDCGKYRYRDRGAEAKARQAAGIKKADETAVA